MSSTTKQQIPAGWKVMRLNDFAEIIMGQSPPSKAYNQTEKGMPFFQGKADFDSKNNKPKIRQYTSEITKIAPALSILFTVRAPVGSVVMNNVEACIGRGLASIKAKEGGVNQFLFYYLQHIGEQFEKYSQGSTFTAINSNELKKYQINVPSFKEQTKIATILSAVDEEIEKVGQIIEKTEKLKQGLMQKLLTRGIGHKKFKKTQLGEIPEAWEVEEFINFATLQRGFDLPKKLRIEGEYPLVSSSGAIDTHSEAKVNAPGVVTGRSGTIGGVSYIEDDFWPLNTTLYIKDFHGNNEKYVYYALQFFNLHDYHSGTGVPTLNRNIVHKQKIVVPPVREQVRIVKILEAADKKLEICEENKSKLKRLRKGIMADLLSGKVRVAIN